MALVPVDELCCQLGIDLIFKFISSLTSLLHHLGFIESGIRMNFIYLGSYWDAGTERVEILK